MRRGGGTLEHFAACARANIRPPLAIDVAGLWTNPTAAADTLGVLSAALLGTHGGQERLGERRAAAIRSASARKQKKANRATQLRLQARPLART